MVTKRQKVGGRQKGTPNKLTATLKEMVLKALDQVGGVEYLAQQASETPTAFIALLGKVLPTQISQEPGDTFKVEHIQRVIVDAAKD